MSHYLFTGTVNVDGIRRKYAITVEPGKNHTGWDSTIIVADRVSDEYVGSHQRSYSIVLSPDEVRRTMLEIAKGEDE